MWKKGFTLIEVMIVIGVVAVLTTVVVMNLSGYRGSLNLKLTAREIVAALRDTQQKSISQENGLSWGVNFLNSSSDTDSYKVFSASSTTGVQKVLTLRNGIVFVDPSDGSAKEISFTKITGRPQAGAFLIIIAKSDDIGDRILIEVSAQGRITYIEQQSLRIDGIDPNYGTAGTIASFHNVVGRGFQDGATVKLSKSGESDISCSGCAFETTREIRGGSFDLQSSVANGAWDVVVTNPDNSSTTLSNGYTISDFPPSVYSIWPSLGISGQTITDIAVTGANFKNGATVKLQKGTSEVVGTGFTFASENSLTGGSFNLNGAEEGWWDIVVTNPDGLSGVYARRFRVADALDGTIDSTDRYAWNDNWGWIDFATTTGNVIVTSDELSGYPWNVHAGWLSLNCADENICSYGTQGDDTGYYYRVRNVSSTGALFGYAWNDSLGWVSMNCDQTGIGGSNTCGTVNYGVVISTTTGIFSGFAWSDVAGWISFNCADQSVCATSDYKVMTTWRPTQSVVYESGGGEANTAEGTCTDESGWSDSESCVAVPESVATGEQTVVVTSDGTDSNSVTFTVL